MGIHQIPFSSAILQGMHDQVAATVRLLEHCRSPRNGEMVASVPCLASVDGVVLRVPIKGWGEYSHAAVESYVYGVMAQNDSKI